MKGIRNQCHKLEDFTAVNEWILACIILHNLLIKLNDIWDDDEDGEDDDDLEGEGNDEGVDVDNTNLRARVQTKLLEWFHNNN